MLPRKIPKSPKRSTRWRSQAHLNFVRSFTCAYCGNAELRTEAAHVRLGSGAGLGQKPDDWRATPLCRGCHYQQHSEGEETFWRSYRETVGQTVEQLIDELCKASPKAAEIRRVRQERELA